MLNRDEYVKPLIMQLHYSTEPEVTIAQACKMVGSAVGATASGCQISETNSDPCAEPGS